jgi:hypothetical protein
VRHEGILKAIDGKAQKGVHPRRTPFKIQYRIQRLITRILGKVAVDGDGGVARRAVRQVKW